MAENQAGPVDVTADPNATTVPTHNTTNHTENPIVDQALDAAQTAPVPPTATPLTETTNEPATVKDVVMTDVVAPEQAASPARAAANSTATNAPSPAPPARTGTPLRTNGQETSSRAASQHPEPGLAMPAEAAPHGSHVRQYLNSKVTGALLDGMKILAKEQPKDPLKVLGEYLLQRSKEVEGST